MEIHLWIEIQNDVCDPVCDRNLGQFDLAQGSGQPVEMNNKEKKLEPGG